MQSQKPSHTPTDKPQQQQGTPQQEQPGRQQEQQNRKQQEKQDQQAQRPSDAAQQQGQQPSQRPHDAPTQRPPSAGQGNKEQVQGEGDYRADRRYTESVKEFVESGKVDEAARKAKPQSQQEANDMRRAEQEGASHAKDGTQGQSGEPKGAQRK